MNKDMLESPFEGDTNLRSTSGATVCSGNPSQAENGVEDQPLEASRCDGHSRHPSDEPIAIIGMGCRLPGGVSSESELWDFLLERRSGQCKIPASRFNIDAFYHPRPDRAGSIPTDGGYFLSDDIRAFDNAFFGINNLEATYMDPQQRLLLETVYESFESAGLSLEDVFGANIGTYVGSFTTDFQFIQGKDLEHGHRYSATGMGTTILANRISHTFNLQGPSLVIDTACSSSLYGLHLACSALIRKECDAALVASANLIQSPEQQLGTSKAGVLSPTSTCHTFDASADGYGRAEGVGALCLKRLSDALRDNDPIRSVIVGTAINSNGKTNGLTLPSVRGQEEVIRKAYRHARLPFNQTDYVECHGTGTPVGDPIEVEALSNVLQHETGRPTLIGSVKTNLGHSEAASGISSIMKVSLALERGAIPATIGLHEPNPNIDLKRRNCEVVSKTIGWPNSSHNPRASVNSFGYGGANAHVIMEAATSHVPKQTPKGSGVQEDATLLLPISANSSSALQTVANNLSGLSIVGTNLEDLAYTLTSRRSRFRFKTFMLASRAAPQLMVNFSKAKLELSDSSAHKSKGRTAFAFTGQGAQWPGMGSELIERYAVFRRTIQDLDFYLATCRHPPLWNLHDLIAVVNTGWDIHQASISQALCTAIQIALVDLLEDWELLPDTVLGHSSGEIAAAYAAGHLSRREAILTAHYRGLVVSERAEPGTMMAVGLGKDAAQAEIDNHGLKKSVGVACMNSPENSTLSGNTDQIHSLLVDFQNRNIFARTLRTDKKAYHSHLMNSSLSEAYQVMLHGIFDSRLPRTKRANAVLMVSSSTGNEVNEDDTANPIYWRRNLQSPVLFADCIGRLLQDQNDTIIEIGPHPTLALPFKQSSHAASAPIDYLPTLKRNENATHSLLHLAGALFMRARKLNLLKANTLSFGKIKRSSSMTPRVLENIPRYPWQHSNVLWKECRMSSEFRNRPHGRHELLGAIMPGRGGATWTWRNRIKPSEIPWLCDHRLGETTVFPAAAYISMATEAVFQSSQHSKEHGAVISLRSFRLLKALSFLNNEDEVELFTEARWTRLSAATDSARWWDFSVSSFADGLSSMHSCGSISLEKPQRNLVPNLTGLKSLNKSQSSSAWYEQLASRGLKFGPHFQALSDIVTNGSTRQKTARSKVRLPLQVPLEHDLHPILIDAMLQTAIIAGTAGRFEDLHARVPVSIDSMKIRYLRPFQREQLSAIAVSEAVGFGSDTISAELFDYENQLTVQMENVRLFAYQGYGSHNEDHEQHPLLRTVWLPDVNLAGFYHQNTLGEYSQSFSTQMSFSQSKSWIGPMQAAFNLVYHSDPSIKILEISEEDGEDTTASFMRLARPAPRLEQYKKYVRSTSSNVIDRVGNSLRLDENGIAQSTALQNYEEVGLFDLVIFSRPIDVFSHLEAQLERLREVVREDGTYVVASSSDICGRLNQIGYDTSLSQHLNQNVMLVRPMGNGQIQKLDTSPQVFMVHDEPRDELSKLLEDQAVSLLGADVRSLSVDMLSEANFGSGATIMSTLEAGRSFLRDPSDEQFRAMKAMTDQASVILWITRAGLTKAPKPEAALASGLSRALMLEQPALKFICYQVDNPDTHTARTATNVLECFVNCMRNPKADTEYLERDGTTSCARLIPDETLNTEFRLKQNNSLKTMTRKEIGCAQLAIESIGQLDSLYFKQSTPEEELQPDYVEVNVSCMGLNAKDLYVLMGTIDTKDKTCSLEFTGIVHRTGRSVSSLRPGDPVIVMAPSHFGTVEHVPEWACCKLRESEGLDTLCTLPVVFSTALYALHDRAQIKPHESILIHSAAGGLGLAAIQIAQRIDAEIYATVGTDAKKQYLMDAYGISPERIFSSRDPSFLPAILAATSGRGVDVVLNSLTAELLHDSWRACADFGRFVEVGKRDILDGGKLDMEVFNRNASFTAFDLSSLFQSADAKQHRLWNDLLNRVMELYRQGSIKPIQPLRIFDCAELTSALRYFAAQDRIGKVAVSMQNPLSALKVLPLKYRTTLNSQKTYLMVGCLGGLGRSLARWMLDRGARDFMFLNRSAVGDAGSPADVMVKDLEQAGARVEIVRGDVTNISEVQEAVKQLKLPLGGVIQAAMGLDESLFSSMSTTSWLKAIRPKVEGTWNLHHAISTRDGDLDFFIMTSSISGSVGTATESNYCAANAFLDSFAGFRRSQGLPATSLGLGMISEVGYLHEHPDIQALLLRKGIHPITEAELLQIFDIALSQQQLERGNSSSEDHSMDHFSDGHILTGLDPSGLRRQRELGFEGTSHLLSDPRARIIAGTLEDDKPETNGDSNGSLPKALTQALESQSNHSLHDAVYSIVAGKLSNLLLQTVETLEPQARLAGFGMDSMLAAEFRTFIYHATGVEVPFMALLDNATTIRGLTDVISTGLQGE